MTSAWQPQSDRTERTWLSFEAIIKKHATKGRTRDLLRRRSVNCARGEFGPRDQKKRSRAMDSISWRPSRPRREN